MNIPPPKPDKVAVKLSLSLQDIAASLDMILKDITGAKQAFALVVAVDGTVQYVSNSDRQGLMKLLEELLARQKANKADIPAHYNPDLKKEPNNG